MSAWEQLAELKERAAQAQRVAEERERQARHAAGEVDRINAALLALVEDSAAAGAEPDVAELERLRAELAAAQGRRATRSILLGNATIEQPVDQIAEAVAAGAKRAAQARAEEVVSFKSRERRRLAGELAEDAAASAEELTRLAAQLVPALDRYRGVERQWGELMGEGVRADLPECPVSVERSLLHGGRVAAPVPRTLTRRDGESAAA